MHHYDLVTDIAGLHGVWLMESISQHGRVLPGTWCGAFLYTSRVGRSRVHGTSNWEGATFENFVGSRDEAEFYAECLRGQFDDESYRVLAYDPKLPERILDLRSRVEKAHPLEREWAVRQAAADEARLLGGA